jgi:hypothetical protein
MKVPLAVKEGNTEFGGATEFQHGGRKDLANDFSHLLAQCNLKFFASVSAGDKMIVSN